MGTSKKVGANKKTRDASSPVSFLWMGGIALIVLLLAFFVLANQTGAKPPVPDSSGGVPTNSGVVQKVLVRALATGTYDSPVVRVKANQPVEFSFKAEPGAGCGSELLIPAFKVDMLSLNGQTKTATFTPLAPGEFDFHCGMRMFRGKLIVE